MKFNISKETNYTSMRIGIEKLDSKVSPALKSQFILLASDPDSGNLIVDLSEVTFADSSGLSALLLAHRLYRETDQILILHSISERVMKLIEISQLTHVLQIAPNLQDAIAMIPAS